MIGPRAGAAIIAASGSMADTAGLTGGLIDGRRCSAPSRGEAIHVTSMGDRSRRVSGTIRERRPQASATSEPAMVGQRRGDGPVPQVVEAGDGAFHEAAADRR